MKEKLKKNKETVADPYDREYDPEQSYKIPIERLVKNDWNPNVMTADQFNLLSDNVDKVGFTQPILVIKLARKKGELQMFRIVDGEHRFEQMRLMDKKMIPCIVRTDLDEATQRKQTMRMNMIHGSVDKKKLAKLVDDLVENFGQDYDELSYELGFPDMDAFQKLLDQARESLPTTEMKTEFDKARKEIKTVDDLSLVLNKLFTEFGDTLPANYMILDFGGKTHIWVRMNAGDFTKTKRLARDVAGHGKTFDSFLSFLMANINIKAFMKANKDELEDIPERPEGEAPDIDDLMEVGDDG